MTTAPLLVLGTPKESPRVIFKRTSTAFNKPLIDVSFWVALPWLEQLGAATIKTSVSEEAGDTDKQKADPVDGFLSEF